MNGYICFFGGKRVEVHATSTYEAQKKAAAVLRVSEKKRSQITVVLAEKQGEPVVHKPQDILS